MREKRNYYSSVLGTAFLWSSNITVMAAFGSVLQIPLQVPVMTRELSNKMYHPLAYLYGRLLSQYIIQIIPPTIMFACLFWSTGMDRSWYNLAWVFLFGWAGDLVWTTMGFFIGLTISDEGDAAKIVLVFCNIVFLSVNGAILNPEKSNEWVKFLSSFTPGKFVTEGFFRCLTENVEYYPKKIPGMIDLSDDQAKILDTTGYHNENAKSLALLYVWLGVWILGSTVSIMWKYGRI